MVTLSELYHLAVTARPGAPVSIAQLLIAWIRHDPHRELSCLFSGLGARKDELLDALEPLVGNADPAEVALLYAGCDDTAGQQATGVDLLLYLCTTPEHPIYAALGRAGMRLNQLEHRLQYLRAGATHRPAPYSLPLFQPPTS